jgi:DNA-binding beta-propeller fold protein YncE
MKSVLILAFVSAAVAAPPGYKVVANIKIGGANRTDYTYCDTPNHRLYVSHGTQTEVIDTAADKLVGTIPDTQGVHGIAIADDLGKGFTSNGTTNNVTVFDIATLKVTGKINTGQNPDSIVYEPVTHRVLTFNGKSGDFTLIDAKTGTVISASVAVGGKPEFSQVDGKGHVFANIEDKNEVIEINAQEGLVMKRYSIAPCDGPSGLAIDLAKMRLFSVCDKVMAISDPTTGKVISTAVVGQDPDGVAFDDGYAFSANRDGAVTMVAETSPGKYAAVATIPTKPGAKTISADQKAHKLYLPAWDIGPAPAGGGRGTPVPDTFGIIVIARQ